MNKVLVIAAHPDDEILGCGGTIAKHCLAGDEVNIAIMAEGLTSRDIKANRDIYKEEIKLLHENTEKAMKILEAKNVDFFNFPDNRMDSADILDVIKKIESLVEKYTPNIVYTHYMHDLNIDHQITSRAVITACRSLPGQCVRQLLFFEVLSSTEWQIPYSFSPNWFVNVEDTFEKKLDALKCYDSEMRQYPHSRSYEGVNLLARYRGMNVGCLFAEAFYLGRNII